MAMSSSMKNPLTHMNPLENTQKVHIGKRVNEPIHCRCSPCWVHKYETCVTKFHMIKVVATHYITGPISFQYASFQHASSQTSKSINTRHETCFLERGREKKKQINIKKKQKTEILVCGPYIIHSLTHSLTSLSAK